MIFPIEQREWLFMFDLLYTAECSANINEFGEKLLKDLGVLIGYEQGFVGIASRDTNGITGSHVAQVNSEWKLCRYFEQQGYHNDDYYKCFYPLNKTTVFRDTEMRNEDEFENLEIYKNFFRPSNVYYGLRASLVFNGSLLGYIVLLNSKQKGDFSEKDKFVLATFADNLAFGFYSQLKNDSSIGANSKSEFTKAISREFDLTRREAEVAEMIRKGKSDAEICEDFSITPSTLNKHINKLYKKTKAENRISMLKIFASF